MIRFIEWMTNVFAPKMNKIAKNVYLSSLQDAILTTMPLIFIGTFATILDIIKEIIPSFPDFSALGSFTFGLLSLFLSFLVPYTIMEKKKLRQTRKQAGLAGIAFFLMIINPVFESGNILFKTSALGGGGMIAAIVAGLFVGFVMSLFGKLHFFDEESAIPDFVTVWFDTLIPIFLIIMVGWLLGFQLQINIFDAITNLFMPLISLGQTFYGFVLVNFFTMAFLYSFGISTWVLYPVMSVICLSGIAANADLVAAGQLATNIHVYETTWIMTIGGGGATLSLAFMLCFLAKSKRLRLLGKATIVPSIFNINEPLVYGTPIAFNPILMIPMWINGFVMPIITYLAFSLGFVPIPTSVFQMWYLPKFIFAFFSTGSIKGTILAIILFAVSWVIYYPFFKIYDKQIVAEEAKEENVSTSNKLLD